MTNVSSDLNLVNILRFEKLHTILTFLGSTAAGVIELSTMLELPFVTK